MMRCARRSRTGSLGRRCGSRRCETSPARNSPTPFRPRSSPECRGRKKGSRRCRRWWRPFDGVKFKKGTHILLKFDPADNLEVGIDTSGTGGPFTDGDAKPKTTIKCALLGRCLLENFLGSASAVPEARQEWGRGGQLLLESEGGGRDADTSGA